MSLSSEDNSSNCSQHLYNLIRRTIFSSHNGDNDKQNQLRSIIFKIHVREIGLRLYTSSSTHLTRYRRSVFKSYSQIRDMSWMCKNGYFNLLNDKLKRNKEDVNITQESIRMFLYYATHGDYSTCSQNTFNSIYQHLQDHFYDDSLLAYCGSIDTLSILLKQTSPRPLDPFTPYFDYNDIYMNRYLDHSHKNTNRAIPFKLTIEFMIINALHSIGNIDLVEYIYQHLILDNNNNNKPNQYGLEMITNYGALLKIAKSQRLDRETKYRCIRYYYDRFSLFQRDQLNIDSFVGEKLDNNFVFGFQDIGNFYNRCQQHDVESHLLCYCDQEIANRIVGLIQKPNIKKFSNYLITLSREEFEETPTQCRQSYITTLLALATKLQHSKKTHEVTQLPSCLKLNPEEDQITVDEFIKFQLILLENIVENNISTSKSISSLINSLCNYFSSPLSLASPSPSSTSIIEYILQLHQRSLYIGGIKLKKNMFDIICSSATLDQIKDASNYLKRHKKNVKEWDDFIFASCQAIDNAAVASRLDVVQYLHLNHPDIGCSERAFIESTDPSVLMYLLSNYESLLYHPDDSGWDTYLFNIDFAFQCLNIDVIKIILSIIEKRNQDSEHDPTTRIKISTITKIFKMDDVEERDKILSILKTSYFDKLNHREGNDDVNENHRHRDLCFYLMVSEVCIQGDLALINSIRKIFLNEGVGGFSRPSHLKCNLLDDTYLNGMNIQLLEYLISELEQNSTMDESFIQITKVGTLKEFKWLESLGMKYTTEKVFLSSIREGNLEIFNYLLPSILAQHHEEQQILVEKIQKVITFASKSNNNNQVISKVIQQFSSTIFAPHHNEIIYNILLENENIAMAELICKQNNIKLELTTKQVIHLLKRASLHVVKFILDRGLINFDYHLYHILNCFTPTYLQQFLHQNNINLKFEKYQPILFKNIKSLLYQQPQQSQQIDPKKPIQLVFSNRYLLKSILSQTRNPFISGSILYENCDHVDLEETPWSLVMYRLERGDKIRPSEHCLRYTPYLPNDWNILKKLVVDHQLFDIERLLGYRYQHIRVLELLILEPYKLYEKIDKSIVDKKIEIIFNRLLIDRDHEFNSWIFKHRVYLTQKFSYIERSVMNGLQYGALKKWSQSKRKHLQREFFYQGRNEQELWVDTQLESGEFLKTDIETLYHLYRTGAFKDKSIRNNSSHPQDRSMNLQELEKILFYNHHLVFDDDDDKAKPTGSMYDSNFHLKQYLLPSKAVYWKYPKDELTNIGNDSWYFYSYFYEATTRITLLQVLLEEENIISVDGKKYLTEEINQLHNRLITKIFYKRCIDLEKSDIVLGHRIIQGIHPHKLYGYKLNSKLLQEYSHEFDTASSITEDVCAVANNLEYSTHLTMVIEYDLGFKTLELVKKRKERQPTIRPKPNYSLLWIFDQKDRQLCHQQLPYYYYIIENWHSFPIPMSIIGGRDDLIEVYQNTLKIVQAKTKVSSFNQIPFYIIYQLVVAISALFYQNIKLLEVIGWKYINDELLTITQHTTKQRDMGENVLAPLHRFTALSDQDFKKSSLDDCAIILYNLHICLPLKTIQLYRENLPQLIEKGYLEKSDQ